jgi:AraC family transcriptional regulator, regulatory protein of adaptative response / methylated-DNA-[protein]-cysteine methyltransferase
MSEHTHLSLATRLESVARYIDAHADESLPLDTLAAQAALSPWHFQRRFKAHFGVSPKQYQDGCRQRRLRAALRSGVPVVEARVDAGLSSADHVYGAATPLLGMPAGRYRRGGAGETLHYVCQTTIEGPLLMAASEVGVCFAEFGTDETGLLAQLAHEFPQATLQPAAPDRGGLAQWMAALNAHLSGSRPAPDLPVDLRGTAFQIKVWRFLRTLPSGARVTYTDVAHGIGESRAVRAAASACGANRIALLVPCHRVLRGDGGLGGYRWGVERKRRFLEREAALPSAQ